MTILRMQEGGVLWYEINICISFVTRGILDFQSASSESPGGWLPQGGETDELTDAAGGHRQDSLRAYLLEVIHRRKLMTPLLFAIALASLPVRHLVETGHLEQIPQVLCEGATVELADFNEDANDANFLMLRAWEKGGIGAVHALVQMGANVDERNEREETALHWAARRGNLVLVQVLLRHGAAVDVQNDKGFTPLHWAAAGGHLYVVDELLSRGANPNAVNVYEATPLHWAAISGSDAVVARLIEAGAKVDVQSEMGYTPLHWAAHGNNGRLVELLLQKGARTDLCDCTGKTAFGEIR